MKEISKWSWIKVAGNIKSEFNSKDFLNSKKFWLIDNQTHRISCLKPILDADNKPVYVDIPVLLQNKEFINWAISTSPDLLEYLPNEFIRFKNIINKSNDKKDLIEKYINGDNIDCYDIEELEDDYKFMINVIRYTKDKNIYELCSDNVKNTYEFVLFMIEEFKCDIEFLINVVDYYLDNEREEVKRIEILIIMCDIFKDSNYIKEYSSLLASIYTTIKFNIESIKNQPTMEFEAIKEVIQEGFYFILEDYNSSNIAMNYFAKKFIIDIINEHNINLEEQIHKDFKTYKELEEYGVNKYLIKLLNKYDTNLADYVICHIDLLNDIEIELDRIKNNWNLYRSFDNKEKSSPKVLKFIPKKNKIDT